MLQRQETGRAAEVDRGPEAVLGGQRRRPEAHIAAVLHVIEDEEREVGGTMATAESIALSMSPP
ncbi:hypothetical protein IQ62_38130 [Streptomyces scabiei]|nr:hypothetical protein IQ62_38130 [Streptomyces scabiei]